MQRTKESDLPPDAIFVLGFVPLLQRFNAAVNLNVIWLRHRPDYDQLIQNLHQPIQETLVSTDIYLKRNLSGYIQHDFVIYLEPLADPGEVNSRNYADDYYIVISPPSGGDVRLDQLRHTYLHYILNPKLLSRGTTLERLSPLLDSVKTAPLDESYRFDTGLLLTESLIRAIEARMLGARKAPEKPKEQFAWESMRQGFILTSYFYAKLVAFENDEVGFDQSYAGWLHDLNVEEQQKYAAAIPFLKSGTPELVRKGQHKETLVDLAERALASGNVEGAQSYVQRAMQKQESPDRALFVLARAAVAQGKLNDAQSYFERAASASSDIKIRGWSHICLGRILDMQEHRQEAAEHYRAALNAGGPPELKAAAEKGLKQASNHPRSVLVIRKGRAILKFASLISAVFLLSATVMTSAQSTPQVPAQNPAASFKQTSPANAKKSPQPKTEAEYDAYKAAASQTDPAKLEAAASDFAQRFPESELRSILFLHAMGLYQQANDPNKTVEMARAALKYDPDNAIALLTAAQVLAERTQDSDLDRNDRLAEANANARSALQSVGDIAPPTNLTPEQFAAALAQIRGTAHEVLATIAFKKQDYLTAIQEYDMAAAEEKEHTDAVVWLRLSVAHDKTGDYTTAAAIVPRAINASQPGSQVHQLAEQEQSNMEKKLSPAAKSSGK